MMRKSMRRTSWRHVVGLAVISAGTLASSACAAHTINQILANPSRYRDRDVRVSGSVVDSYSLVDRGVYRLDDHSGQLWVVSDRGVPRKGARVTVQGTIREGFNLGSLGNRAILPPALGSGLIMMESSHKATD
ncbi:MAG: hypothetical protein C5B57_10985 [Blastocatellia bacterium]|nr:MAG: hypothetical protein C5B57_10985 [Blastocatellia bacterium]